MAEPDPGTLPPLATAIDELASLGLQADDARVYRQVVGSRAQTAQALARALHLPATSVERSLDRLVLAGLLRRSAADVPEYVTGHGVLASGRQEPRFEPQPPSVTLAALLESQAAALVRAGAAVEQLARWYDGDREPTVDEASLCRSVHGPEAVARTVTALLDGTRRELLNLDRQPYVQRSEARSVHEAMTGLLSRGVRVRTVYARDAYRVAGYAAYMTEAAGLGEQARVVAHLPLRYVVSDRTVAVLPLAAEGPWVGSAVVLRGRVVVHDLVEAFDDVWNRASAVDAGGARPADCDLDEHEVALLRMLAADMTESAIGRHVGASTRTVGRRVARLQRKLGARTRFGLGAEAARRGLL
jgi:sugar-specific transcriptional regulator TrmB/DNA-binding CsgD family transcriptional regulator